MKKLGITIVLVVAACLMSGCAYLYAQFNIHHHTAYYVQHMPRKKGTNPELALIADNVFFMTKPDTDKISYDIDIITYEDRNLRLSLSSNYRLRDYRDEFANVYVYDSEGRFTYAMRSYEDINVDTTDLPKNEAKIDSEKYAKILLTPILKDAKKPLINLQWLFNRKYAKRFN